MGRRRSPPHSKCARGPCAQHLEWGGLRFRRRDASNVFFCFFFFCGFNSVRRSLADAWASNIFSVCLFPKGGGARDNGRGSQHLAHFVVRVFFCRCGPSLPSAAGGARPQPPNEALISRRFGGQAVIFGMGGGGGDSMFAFMCCLDRPAPRTWSCTQVKNGLAL